MEYGLGQAEPILSRSVWIPGPGLELEGLFSPAEAGRGIVIFAHGSGSSRLSPRNLRTAQALAARGLGTLLLDLLTHRESLHRANVFDIPLLAERLLLATRWVLSQEEYASSPLGFFGASTGAAAALAAAAELGSRVRAVVSRGGRPDLAGPLLGDVSAPTLLLVGGNDPAVLSLNRQALRELRHGELQVIPGASHLFEEEGTMALVEEYAAFWFQRHFAPREGSRVA